MSKKRRFTEEEKQELESILKKAQKELSDFKMQNAVHKLKNPHEITTKRKEIARVLTRIKERKLKK